MAFVFKGTRIMRDKWRLTQTNPDVQSKSIQQTNNRDSLGHSHTLPPALALTLCHGQSHYHHCILRLDHLKSDFIKFGMTCVEFLCTLQTYMYCRLAWNDKRNREKSVTSERGVVRRDEMWHKNELVTQHYQCFSYRKWRVGVKRENSFQLTFSNTK